MFFPEMWFHREGQSTLQTIVLSRCFFSRLLFYESGDNMIDRTGSFWLADTFMRSSSKRHPANIAWFIRTLLGGGNNRKCCGNDKRSRSPWGNAFFSFSLEIKTDITSFHPMHQKEILFWTQKKGKRKRKIERSIIWHDLPIWSRRQRPKPSCQTTRPVCECIVELFFGWLITLTGLWVILMWMTVSRLP